MPIYHDYHGDAKSSSISHWDQIQICLKILLPSYQPVLSDSAAVESFLTDQKQMQIDANFQQTCASIIATMVEIQEEENSKPEMHAAHKEAGEEELRVPLAVLPRPWMTESGQNGGVAIGAEDGTAGKGRIATVALEPAEVAEMILPPPKPPDLDPAMILGVTSPYMADMRHPKGDGGERPRSVAGLRRREDKSSAADGSPVVESQKTISSVGDGAAVEYGIAVVEYGIAAHKAEPASREEDGTRDSAAGDGDRRTSSGQKPPRRRYIPFVGKPPILLATVLPWTRDKSPLIVKKEEGASVHKLVIVGDFAATTTAKQREEAVVVFGGGSRIVAQEKGKMALQSFFLFKIENDWRLVGVGEQLLPFPGLGLHLMFQAQFNNLLCELTFGLNASKNYFKLMLGLVYFKQSDPGGSLYFW
ncbi:hypothetical protein PIB30_043770 [Stylosanthes scabra]|uniref:Uncharacterized protein n=1 Tax=Stylosanthes scabra TaxID=79078 RepID=A0ABU6QG48_9FABA|nr:hypothetical protein [Stylosanthes scabra]